MHKASGRRRRARLRKSRWKCRRFLTARQSEFNFLSIWFWPVDFLCVVVVVAPLQMSWDCEAKGSRSAIGMDMVDFCPVGVFFEFPRHRTATVAAAGRWLSEERKLLKISFPRPRTTLIHRLNDFNPPANGRAQGNFAIYTYCSFTGERTGTRHKSPININ